MFNSVLIGYSGFVGSHILRERGHFDALYRSTNIEELAGASVKLLVCAGVSAVKWFANKNPHQDLDNIQSLTRVLETVHAERVVWISTIDIYDAPQGVDEDSLPDVARQDAYGKHRYDLERWVQSSFRQTHVVRLPALLGQGLKKNFLYDLVHPIPAVLVSEKFVELESAFTEGDRASLHAAYAQDDSGQYRFQNSVDHATQIMLLRALKAYGFTALNFTDSRSKFPFYDMTNIWKDIQVAVHQAIPVLNLSVEPLSCAEVVEACLGERFQQEIPHRAPLLYDFRSKYAHLWRSEDGYLYHRAETLTRIQHFLQEQQNDLRNL